jgi:hypothetical protein
MRARAQTPHTTHAAQATPSGQDTLLEMLQTVDLVGKIDDTLLTQGIESVVCKFLPPLPPLLPCHSTMQPSPALTVPNPPTPPRTHPPPRIFPFHALLAFQADFDLYSFSELVELGLKPAHVKRIKAWFSLLVLSLLFPVCF